MLMQVNGREIEAPLHTIQQNFWVAMDEFKLQAAPIMHEFMWFFLQTCSQMLPDDELIKKNAKCLKKFEEIVREFFLSFWWF
jgi:hypothetical protein